VIIDFSRAFRLLSSIVVGVTLLAVRAFDQAVFDLRVRGKENLWPARAFLVTNHSLFLDPAVVADVIRPRRAYFSVLERTLDTPLLGSYVRLLGGFPVPAHRPLERIRTAVRRALACTGLVHFFPEGELHYRSPTLSRFRDGVFLLAIHEGVPVVPLTLVATPRTLAGHALGRWPPRVRAVISPPIDPAPYLSRGRNRIEAARAMARDAHAVMSAVLAGPIGGTSG
jgi:1-acyl-sn-glycerol-3-phosphate acyltransferase